MTRAVEQNALDAIADEVLDGIRERASRDDIDGQNRTHYCGAWGGNGFHEDGVVSARQVADVINALHPVPAAAAATAGTPEAGTPAHA